jgi:hypothetical protein
MTRQQAAPRCGEQERLGPQPGVPVVVEQDSANRLPHRRPARFSHSHHASAAGLERIGEAGSHGRLTRTVYALEDDVAPHPSQFRTFPGGRMRAR